MVGRLIASLIKTPGVGDLYRMFTNARSGGTDYNAIWIPGSFTLVELEPFDLVVEAANVVVRYSLQVKRYVPRNRARNNDGENGPSRPWPFSSKFLKAGVAKSLTRSAVRRSKAPCYKVKFRPVIVGRSPVVPGGESAARSRSPP